MPNLAAEKQGEREPEDAQQGDPYTEQGRVNRADGVGSVPSHLLQKK